MFYEYAIDPVILSDLERCKAFFNGFQNKPHHLISDAPKNWSNYARQQIDAIPHELCKPVMKKTLKKHLKDLLDKNLIRNRIISSGLTNWDDFSAEEHQKYPFSAILGMTSKSKPVLSYEFDNLLFESPGCWHEQNQCHVDREASAIIDKIMPLLVISKQIHLVDRIFTFIRPKWGYYESLIKELIKRAPQYNFGKGISVINIHSSDKYGNLSDHANKNLLPILPEGITINVYQWPFNTMHDRFIITDVGGVQIGHGLDEKTDNNAKQALMTALDNNTLKVERRKISGEPIEKFSISK